MKKKNLIISISPIIIIPLFSVAVNFYRNNLSDFFLICPWRFFLHKYCIGCGGTHSIYALASGNFPASLKYNPLVFAGFVFLFLLWLENLIALSGREIHIVPRNRKFYIISAVFFTAFFILRNIVPALAPF